MGKWEIIVSSFVIKLSKKLIRRRVSGMISRFASWLVLHMEN